MVTWRGWGTNWCGVSFCVVTVLCLLARTDGSFVIKMSACSARVDSGLINLMPLGDGNLPVFTTEFHGWNYSYKPCVGFNKPDNPYAGFGDTCLSVAVCKYQEQLNSRAYYYTLGYNQNVTFILPDDDEEEENRDEGASIKIMFKGFRSMKGKRTFIRLVCDRSRTKPGDALFKIIRDLPRRGDVEAELHHLCCCPDGCPVHQMTHAGPSLSPADVTYQSQSINYNNFNTSTNNTDVLGVPEEKIDEIEMDRTRVMIIVGINLGVIFLAGAVGLLCYNKKSHREIYSKLPGARAVPEPSFMQIGSIPDIERGSPSHGHPRTPLVSQSSVDSSRSGYRDGEPHTRRKSLCFPVLESCSIPEHMIEMGQRLGGGIFGDTYVGNWTGFKISVKRITLSVHEYQTDQEHIKKFEEEVFYMSQQRHRNIVSVLGFCSESKHPYVVSEFIHGQVVKDLVKTMGEGSLSWNQRVKILSQVADGMAFLHSNKPPILHRDLRCANLFVTNSDVTKICDFGIVKLTQPLRVNCQDADCCCQGLYSACPPSVGWTAPEILEHPNTSETEEFITIYSDVYSFAIVMWELLHGDDPFEDFHTVQEVIDHVIEGGRPEIPNASSMLPVYVELMQKLWVPNSEERLNFKQITVQLKEISHQAKVFQKMLNNRQSANKTKTVSFSSDVSKEGS